MDITRTRLLAGSMVFRNIDERLSKVDKSKMLYSEVVIIYVGGRSSRWKSLTLDMHDSLLVHGHSK